MVPAQRHPGLLSETEGLAIAQVAALQKVLASLLREAYFSGYAFGSVELHELLAQAEAPGWLGNELLEAIAKKDAALQFYADKASWQPADYDFDDNLNMVEVIPTVYSDRGERARIAL